MSAPLPNPVFEEDLHMLMAIAVICGQRGVEADLLPVYQTWMRCYPDDALGPLGLGLHLIVNGEAERGYNIIADAANTSKTRADQARDVLESLNRDMLEAVE